MKIKKYVVETSSILLDRTEFDYRAYKLDLTTRVQDEVDPVQDFTNVWHNRALFSVCNYDNSTRLSLPTSRPIGNGNIIDYYVTILFGGTYPKTILRTDIEFYPTDFSYAAYLVDGIVKSFQCDAALILLYQDKTTGNIVNCKKFFLMDNTK